MNRAILKRAQANRTVAYGYGAAAGTLVDTKCSRVLKGVYMLMIFPSVGSLFALAVSRG